MEFYVNIDWRDGRKTGTIHYKTCPWANPIVKTDRAKFWFGTLTVDAAQRLIRGLEAVAYPHDFCIDPVTLEPTGLVTSE